MKTDVGIVGCGPSGLLLARLLQAQGIASVILEKRERSYVEARIRAGVLEPQTLDVLDAAGVGARARARGMPHGGFDIVHPGGRFRIDLEALTGHVATVYGQTEITRDLIATHLEAGGAITFDAQDVALHGIEGEAPAITYRVDGEEHHLVCRFIAGCDGFHGIARASIPPGHLQVFEQTYPFGWLGVLSETKPASHELIYATHADGFALASMRGPKLSRSYVQCPIDDAIEAWSDDRFWSAFATRIGPDAAATLETGPAIEKGIAPLRSFVAAPMRFGRLFLAGDAAHIVPPTGAKGLNLAAADIRVLASALVRHFNSGDDTGLDAYSDICLARIWNAQRFSWSLTKMLHRFDTDTAYSSAVQQAELDYLATSVAAQTALAENYVGLPFSHR
ncbi:MAG: 4-hydroxybenzoate 3-monooxygenase [Pseudomonadota bacterium]